MIISSHWMDILTSSTLVVDSLSHLSQGQKSWDANFTTWMKLDKSCMKYGKRKSVIKLDTPWKTMIDDRYLVPHPSY